MNDKKYSTHLGIINSEKWKQLRAYFNQYTFEYNNFDYSKTENEVIEYLRILYSNIDKQLNNALEYLQTNGSISILEKNKILAYSKELNKLKFECEQKLISLNSKPLDYELLFFDYMDLVETQKKKVLEDTNKIQQEFNNFIKIEAPEIKEPEVKESINKKKFEVLLNFANGNYYKLQQNGYSNNRIAKTIFKLTEKKEIENYAQYLKCTNTNNPNDKQNKSKSLFQNIELLHKVIKYCEENKITIHNQFQKEYSKINQNKYD